MTIFTEMAYLGVKYIIGYVFLKESSCNKQKTQFQAAGRCCGTSLVPAPGSC